MNAYNQDEIIEWTPSMMLEVYLDEPDDFLKIKETLSRIGISSRKEENVLYPSCHILHKQGKYFIVHFKELFLLDGKPSNLTAEDLKRRNTISILLSDWGLLHIANPDKNFETISLKQFKIIPFKEKQNWDIRPKYNIGNVKKKR